MPPHLTYCEPYAGSLAVLFAKDPAGTSEVVNDIHRGLTTFWRVLQSPSAFELFSRVVQAVPVSEVEWETDQRMLGEPQVECAVNFFVRCRQSLAGRGKTFTLLTKNRLRRGMNEQASAWLSAVEGLPQVHDRLQRVVILNRDALQVIQQMDNSNTLFYLDPPYLPSTRSAAGVYEHEMGEEDHKRLLGLILEVKGKVLLSGYPSGLYDGVLRSWNRHVWELPNHAAGGDNKRRMNEIVWSNF